MKDNGNGVIGVQERREISKIISEEYNRKEDTLSQQIKFTQGEILTKAQRHFGIALINQEISNLKKKIEMMEQKKKQLGFNSYDQFETAYDNSGNMVVTHTTKAGKFYWLKVRATSDMEALREERNSKLKKLWLTDDRETIKALANSPIKVKMIEHK